MRTPPAATVRPLAALLCVLTVLAGGCGSGPGPRAWAAAVCQALTPWRVAIGDLTASTQRQMTATTTPAQAQENLVRLMAGAEEASERARKAVQDAGVPDVDQGEAVARGFLTSLGAVRDAYGRARRTIEGLSTASAGAFYAGVRAAVDTLGREYDASALDTSRLDSPELRRAFDEVPECR